MQSDSDVDDESQDESESISKPSLAKSNRNPQHLPDHMFSAAFTPQTRPSSSKRQLPASAPRKIEKVRKRERHAQAKDLIVGSRAVRALSNPSRRASLPASMTIPPLKIKKFVNRSLNIKGNKSKTKGWERRPANIGVLRRDGAPAFGFVRGQ